MTVIRPPHTWGDASSVLYEVAESGHFIGSTSYTFRIIAAQLFEGTARIVAITSDHTVCHLSYGASKGAMDRIVLAAAWEFRTKGITANVINPGGTDTGWMSEETKAKVKEWTLAGRIGQPQDCANLVNFLCSKEGGWINAQLLYSNGGRM